MTRRKRIPASVGTRTAAGEGRESGEVEDDVLLIITSELETGLARKNAIFKEKGLRNEIKFRKILNLKNKEMVKKMREKNLKNPGKIYS